MSSDKIPGNVPIAHLRRDGAVQALEDHLCNVARMAAEFAAPAGLSGAAFLCGLLHDLGKFSKEFQDYIRSGEADSDQDADVADEAAPGRPARGRVDHSTAGAQRIWSTAENRSKARPAAQALALCVASHHSGLIDCVAPDETPVFWNRMEKDDGKTHLAECGEALSAVLRPMLSESAILKAIQEFHNVDVSVKRRFPGLGRDEDADIGHALQRGMLIRFLLSCLVDADHTDSADFDDPDTRRKRLSVRPRPWDILGERLEGHLAGLARNRPIDGIRTEISDSCLAHAADAPGLFSLTVPTGGGKTLASLRFALHHARTHGLDRVIYVVPYTSIIEQNAEIARGILEPEEERGDILLEHHSSLLPEKETWRGKLLSRNWDAPVIFTTMVQFMETLFGSGTRRVRRMHNLARSVIVFDEAQAVPIRLFRLFCMANDFLMHVCGASVVLCTATQPSLEALPHPLRAGWPQPPQPRELAPDVPGLFEDLRRVRFEDHCGAPMSLDGTADLAVRCLGETGSCLVVGNVRSWVRKLFDRCCGRLKDEADVRVVCLTTHLCPAHRAAILDDLRKRLADGERVLCCSTQLIECGVDISFGSVIRAAAGLESILQSAGRCNRHGERPEGGVAHVILPDPAEEGGLSMLKDISLARDTFLDFRPRLAAGDVMEPDRPEHVRSYFAGLLIQRAGDLPCGIGERGRDSDGWTLEDLLSLNSSRPEDRNGMACQAFATAARNFRVISNGTRAVLIASKKVTERLPGGQGEISGYDVMTALASSERFGARRELLRRAQRFSVNLFQKEIEELDRRGALMRLLADGGDSADDAILAIDERFYDEEIGVILEPKGEMSTFTA